MTGRRDQRQLPAARIRKALFLGSHQPALLQDFSGARLRDPVSGEIGKSILFAVSQHHAASWRRS
jgi:type I restriction enzyme R subunit